jgi:glycerophosphoryl diester phosphodiesterase
MPKIRCRSEIDAPSGDMHAIVAALRRLAGQTATGEQPGARGLTPDDDALDYDASIEVFDVLDDEDAATGRALVVWTVTFPVREVCAAAIQRYRDAAFTDFVERLGLEWPAVVGIAS